MKNQRGVLGAGFVFSLVVFAHSVCANPEGGTIVSGAARFDRLPGRLTINQGSDRLIINWRDFSIAAGETTKFIQPSAHSAALNRVLSGNPSRIFGNLEANGKVFLINPNGVLVGKGAVINTRSFLASTLDVSDASFLSGTKLTLSGDSTAGVVNEGAIEAIGGDVYLIGRTVENSGSIRAANGTAGLAAGSEVVIVPTGRERVSVIAGNVDGAPAGTGVKNLGTIEAASAELKAAGGNIYALAINNGGVIRATGVERRGGRVYLTSDGGNIENSGTISAQKASGSGGTVFIAGGHNAESPSTVINSGTIDARGNAAGRRGGEVRMTGDHVGLFGTGLIDVSGHSGGGIAQIGGGYQGSVSSIQNADRTFIGQDAVIKADASVRGDGGRVIVWANGVTRYYGSISARGGSEGGNGGFSEVSGKDSLDYRGSTDLTAPLGRTGSLLLDPKFIVIANGGGAPADSGSNEFLDNAAGTATISPANLVAALNTADVTLQANTDITFDNDVDASGNANVRNLTLEAGRSILISANVAVNLRGAFNATFNSSAADAVNRDVGAAQFTMGNNSSIRARGGIDIRGGTLAADSTGATSISANTGNILIETLSSVSSAAGTGGGDIRIVNNAAAGKDVTITTGGSVHSGGTDASAPNANGGNGGDIEITASGALSIRNLISTGGAKTGSGSDGIGGDITLISGDNLTVLDTAEDIDAGSGKVALSAGRSGAASLLTIDGNVTGRGGITLAADRMTVGNTLNSGAEDIVFQPFNPGTEINLGGADATGAPNTLGLTDAELDQVATSGNIVIGNAGAGNITVSANIGLGGEAVSLITGGAIIGGGFTITADTLSATAAGSVVLSTTVDSLSVDTSSANGNQTITEANGLTALNLNAGSGDVDLTLTLGALTDGDPDLDIAADVATVTLSDAGATARDFGASGNRIRTSVNDLTVDTSASGGSQFITEADGLTALNLNAGSGDVDLTLTLGALTDADGNVDIAADGATVTLSDGGVTPRDFGSSGSRIRTSVNELAVQTSAGGGSQFITEDDGLTAVDLNAGAGDVDLILTLGALTDADSNTDITADAATVTLSDAGVTPRDFGASGDRIRTSVNDLTVDTSAGGGSQFVREVNGLTALSLNAGAGNVDLVLTAGSVTDTDGTADLTGVNVDVLLDAAGDIGTAANPLGVGTVTTADLTATGGGVHFSALTAGDLEFVSSTDNGTDITTIFTQAGSTYTAKYADSASGDLTVQADGSILDNVTPGQTILAPSGTLTLIASGDIGDLGGAAPLLVRAAELTAISGGAAGDDINITEADGLTALNLNAGAGDANLVVTAGSVTDTDGAADVTGANVDILLNGVGDIGSTANPLGIGAVTGTADFTAAGGGVHFSALVAGDLEFVSSTDNGNDITTIFTQVGGGTYTATYADSAAGDFTVQADGSILDNVTPGQTILAPSGTLTLIASGDIGDLGGAAPLLVQAAELTATSGGALGDDINITEADGLTALDLNAGAGDVNLVVTTGSVTDTDGTADVTGANVDLTVSGAGSIGSTANPLGIGAVTGTADFIAGGGGVHFGALVAGDLEFVSSTDNGNDITTIFTQLGGGTYTATYADSAAGDLTVEANGSILDSVAPGQQLLAPLATLTLIATDDIGNLGGSPLTVRVAELTATSGGVLGDDINITEADGLTALNLNAGAGDVNLVVTAGAVTDTDVNPDIVADHAAVVASAFGATGAGNAIQTSVNDLDVNTSAANGGQFIVEANGLTALSLNAGSGDVELTLTAGAVADTDVNPDIIADQATVVASAFGATGAGNAIQTSVNDLSVNTSAANGGQFIVEANGLTGLSLNAGSGDVELTLTAGAVADIDANPDIIADQATVVASAFGATGAGNAIQTSVNDLSVNTSAANGGQFIVEANGLTALDLNAGSGDVELTLTAGAVVDTDGTTDITAGQATVVASAFGATGAGNAIQTSVNDLGVNTSAANGGQFIVEANGLTGLNLNAGSGDVELTLTAGAVADTDANQDIIADQATVVASAFGAIGAGNAIQTTVGDLSVNTSAANGGQFIVEANGLTALDLNAGSGDVELTLTAGAVTDTDANPDIIANRAMVVASAFGAAGANNAIQTSVNDLGVNTSAANGGQFIVEANGLTGLNLNAGSGDVELTLTAGAVADTDANQDIVADQASVVATAFGAAGAGNAIQTGVNELSVNTSAANGGQFIVEGNGLTALNLNAGSGNVELTLTAGGVADIDPDTDITAANVDVSLGGVGSIGSITAPIEIGGIVGTVDLSAPGGGVHLGGLTAEDLVFTSSTGDASDVTTIFTQGAKTYTVTYDRGTSGDFSLETLGNISALAGLRLLVPSATLGLNAGGTITSPDGALRTDVGTFTGSGTSIRLDELSTVNSSLNLDTVSASSGELSVRAAGSVNVVGATSAGTDITIIAEQSVAIGAATTANGGGITIEAGQSVSLGAATTAGEELTIEAGGDVNLVQSATASGGDIFVSAGQTVTLQGTANLNASEYVILVGRSLTGIRVNGTPTVSEPRLFFATSVKDTIPPVIGNSIGNLGADRIVTDRPFPDDAALQTIIAEQKALGGSAFIFSSPDQPPPDPEIFIDITMELYRPVSINFGEYDPNKFGEVGDLWMSSSELYEIERKAGKAPKPLPAKVDKSSYVPESK